MNRPLTLGSLFAGIGGFDLGFERAGLHSLWRCEIEAFCQRVLINKLPPAEIYENVKGIGRSVRRVDVLTGGFPCQDVSVANRQRKGLSGERSGLFWEMHRIVGVLQPKWVVIENVPGLLSSNRGRDFAAVVAALVERRYGVVWRVLDSRYFGVAQRRRRVFLVLRAGSAGRRPAQILLESESRTGGLEAGDQAGPDVAATLRGRPARRGVNEPGRGGEDDSNLVAIGVHANQRGELRTSSVAGSLTADRSATQYEGVAFALRADPGGIGQGHNTNFNAFNWQSGGDLRLNASDKPSALSASQTPAIAHALTSSMHKRHDEDMDTLIASPITASAGHHGHSSPRGDGRDNIVAATLLSPHGGQRTDDLNQTFTPTLYGVRRLSPLECERVQGFPDGWTCLCGEGWRGSRYCTCPDTPRYKALGNAVTVPVARWIAERIKEAEGLTLIR